MLKGVKPKKEKDHGMYECIKREIREIMHTDNEKGPKAIHRKLISDCKYTEKYLPRLKQVQNFVGHYRKSKFNKNIIAEIQQCKFSIYNVYIMYSNYLYYSDILVIKDNQLSDDLADDEMFFFNIENSLKYYTITVI